MAKSSGGAGEILALLRDGTPRTKSELAQLTGQTRTTVAVRLGELLENQLIREVPELLKTAGRPSVAYEFVGASQFVLAADISEHLVVVAVTNLRAQVLAHWSQHLVIYGEPERIVSAIIEKGHELLDSLGRGVHDLVAVGVGIASAVEFGTGHAQSASLGPGWAAFDLIKAFSDEFGCPTLVDNDANVLALGEQRTNWPEARDFVYVKLGGGIAAGIISNGLLTRGAGGVSGDIGHIFAPEARDLPCSCGRRGCVASIAGGQGMADLLTERGIPCPDSDAVLELAQSRNPEAAGLVREAALALGGVLATLVAVLNPSIIAIGGEMAILDEPLISGVRAGIFERTLLYASKDLQVVRAQDSELMGVIGAAHMMLDAVLHPNSYQSTFSG